MECPVGKIHHAKAHNHPQHQIDAAPSPYALPELCMYMPDPVFYSVAQAKQQKPDAVGSQKQAGNLFDLLPPHRVPS